MNWTLLQNSLLVAGLTMILATLGGFLAALWAQGLSPGGRKLVVGVGIAVVALPPFLVINSWLHLFGSVGVIHTWLPFNLYSLTGTVFILTFMFWPIALFSALAAWNQIQPSHLECDPFVRGSALIRHLAWPMARPALFRAAAIIFVLALNHFAIPAILQVKVLPAEMWLAFSTNFDYATSLVAALPLMLASAVLLFVLSREGMEWPFAEGVATHGQFRRQLGGTWQAAGTIMTVVLVVFGFVLPMGDLLATPRSWTELSSAVAAGRPAMWHSFLSAGGAATLLILVAILSQRAGRASHRWQQLLWITFLIPGVFLGVVLTFALNRSATSAIYQSSGIVLIALALRYAGPAASGVGHALGAMDRDLDDAARLEGASFWQRLWYIHRPQTGPALAAAWYVIYLLCLWDTETLLLILPPGGETLAVRIFNLLHYGHNTQINALCLVLLFLALLPLLVWVVANWMRTRWSSVKTASVLVLVGIILSGCGESSATSAALQSKVFSKVEIIGSRGTAPGQFNKPRSLALDRNDNLYVADLTGRIQKFSPEGKYLLSWEMPQTDKGRAKGMGMDKDGNIIVIEPHYIRINHFSPEGKLVRQWSKVGTNAGEIVFPRAVARTSKGELWVAEHTMAERVQLFTADYGKSLRVIEGFNRAEGVAVDAKDRLYVADSCNHQLKIFEEGGKPVATLGGAGSAPGKLSYPYEVRVDSQGRIYVCEFGNSRVQVFGPDFQPLEIIGGIGMQPGQFFNPWSIALDSMGNLYVADSGNHRVQKFILRPKP